jgi:sulfite reductase (ferredoxin)
VSATSLYRLPESLPQDLEQLRQLTGQFQRGEIPAARYQAFRVPQGIYEQRESGTFMLRVRLPAGMFLPQHLRAVAEVARKYGSGQIHLTSRQDAQIHRVSVDGIYPAVAELAAAGLSTKGGGGNTVRNIATCPHAGVCAKEAFDVTGDVVALTEYLLSDPLSFQLPRKYKIAFSGCGRDCAGATVNDLGLIAKEREGVPGFAVYVGGGMGANSRVGTLLEEFIAASVVPATAEAVKRVFDKHGNRKNRHHARIRFLIEDLGFEAFRELYRQELAGLPQVSANRPQESPVIASAPARGAGQPSAPGFAQWASTSASPQKQAGYFVVEINTPLGMIESDRLAKLADVVDRYGEKRLRATNWQNLVLRWVGQDQLPSLHGDLAAVGLAGSPPALLRHLVVCTGASTCRLGICLARGLAGAVAAALANDGIDLSGPAGELSLHISGCPNSCGRHPVAQIGLFGAARRVHGHLAPHYVVQLGGHVEEGRTVLASGTTLLPARNVPTFLVELLKAYDQSSQKPDFQAFLKAGGRETVERLAQQYAAIPSFDEDKNFYYDWGAQEAFSLAGRGPGECGAGVFDLIAVDLASAAEALAADRLFAATALAARALLVTRGEQADSDLQSLTLFRKHFVEQNAISARLHPLVDQALEYAKVGDPAAPFRAAHADVADLLAEVQKIYAGLGPSLRVTAPTAPACDSSCNCHSAPAETPTVSLPPADQTVDFRGVACPLNYVKTTMALGKLRGGQTLAILLDKQGATNVPTSAANDGHEVLGVNQVADHWRVVLRKKA